MSIAKYSDCSQRRNKLRNFPTNLLPVAAAAPRTRRCPMCRERAHYSMGSGLGVGCDILQYV